jgi:hypothetical protein
MSRPPASSAMGPADSNGHPVGVGPQSEPSALLTPGDLEATAEATARKLVEIVGEPTIKAYVYDPTGEKARTVKARYVGVCRGCGAYTRSRNGKGDAYAYCKACHPGAIERRWTRERVLEAMRVWREVHGQIPTSYDWSRTHARRRGGEALERLARGDLPAASVVYPPVRYVGCRPRGRLAGGRGAAGERPVVSDLAIGQ